MLKGYNIYTADPSSNRGNIGPGFEAFILDPSYSDKSLTIDLRFEIPNNYQLNRIQTCNFSITSTEIRGKTSFKNAFEAIVGVTETVKGTAFSASANFKNVSEETSKNKKGLIYSKVECKVYSCEMYYYNPPRFHKSFIAALNILQKNIFDSKPEAYWKFIKRFGTTLFTKLKWEPNLVPCR